MVLDIAVDGCQRDKAAKVNKILEIARMRTQLVENDVQ